jgi:ATP-dependent helicase/nuclease subunit A
MTRAEKELYVTGCLEITGTSDTDDNNAEEDFSLKIKDYIDRKTKDNKNLIAGDTILDNDTLFGLLLPAIASHIPTTGLAEEPGFFSIRAIPAYTEEYINSRETRNAALANDQEGLNAFFEKTGPFYQSAEVVRTPDLRDNHLTPTSLKREKTPADYSSGKSAIISREFSGEESGDVFKKVDSVLARFSETSDGYGEKFNSGCFGTIAHICAEALLNGKEPVIPPGVAGFLNHGETELLLAAGKELAIRFLRSPLGKIAESAQLRESEFPFRSLLKDSTGKEFFISGTVDLFFEDRDSVHVVDFKTNIHEIPGEHIVQMACYYRAIHALFAAPAKKECRIWLYYLRTGHAVEMTQKAKQFDLDSAAFSVL